MISASGTAFNLLILDCLTDYAGRIVSSSYSLFRDPGARFRGPPVSDYVIEGERPEQAHDCLSTTRCVRSRKMRGESVHFRAALNQKGICEELSKLPRFTV